MNLLIALLLMQVPGEGTSQSGGYGGFGVYVQMFDFKSLNKVIKAHGIEELDNMLYCIGGGGYGIAGKALIGGFGMGGSTKSSSDSISLKAEYGMGAFEAGYALLDFSVVTLFGGLGIGGGSFELTLKPVLNDVSFDSLLNNPRRYSKVKFSSFMLSPFLMLLISPSNSPVSFAVKGGYNFGIGGKWKLDDGGDVLSPPDFKLRGAYITINIMFGGRETATSM